MQKNLTTLEQSINLARIFETVLFESSSLKQKSLNETQQVNKINKSSKTATCASCGSGDHPRTKCRFRTALCRTCNKEGHIAKVCRSAKTNKHSLNTVVPSSLNQVVTSQPMRVRLSINHGTKVDFQLDTGSPITLVDDRVWNQLLKPKLDSLKMKLNSFTGHSIPLKGETLVDVKYNGQTFRLRMFVLCGSGTNILGRDWIESLGLHTKTLDEITSSESMSNVNVDSTNLNQLFVQYKDIFQPGLGRCKVKAHLFVKPEVNPRFCKPKSLPFAYRQAVENDLDRLVSEGVLESVHVSKWAAPIVVVPKPGGKVRICADLSTSVNQALDINQYPLPKPNDLFVALNGGKVFSKIDLSEAYLQVELDDTSKDLLVINTHKGLFRYNRLPFGVASAPSIFQKIMDEMLTGIDGVVCYLDDIIVTGTNTVEHLRNLAKVFAKIHEYGFWINKTKCVFMRDQVEYLGFVVNQHGVHTSPSKVQAITDMPRPINLSQLRSFSGLVNHYGKFIPQLTDRLSPFHALLKKTSSWEWTEICQRSFDAIKRILTSPLALAHYDPSLPLILAADASNFGIGAVIYHRYPMGQRKPSHTHRKH